MHACGSVPIVMVHHLAALWAAGAPVLLLGHVLPNKTARNSQINIMQTLGKLKKFLLQKLRDMLACCHPKPINHTNVYQVR